MKTLKLKAKIDKKGHLKIDVPTQLTEGEVEIILVIEQNSKVKRDNIYDFSDLSGKLQWRGDPLQVQRSLRNEW